MGVDVDESSVGRGEGMALALPLSLGVDMIVGSDAVLRKCVEKPHR